MKPLRKILAAGLALAGLDHAAQALTLQPTADTSGATTLTTSAGNATTLPASPTLTPYIQFGVATTGITAAQVSQARLTLYLPSVTKPGNLQVHQVLGPWFESLIGPAQAVPAVAANPVAVISAAEVIKKKFVTVDVTALVQFWLNNPATEFGFNIVYTGPGKVTLGAKEGSGTGYPAVLDIDLNNGGSTGPQGPQGPIGPAGPQGPAGTATIADATVTSAKLASGLTLSGTTTFSGMVNLPATTGAGLGTVSQNGTPLIHSFGFANFFAGSGAGNFTMSGSGNVAVGGATLSSNTDGVGNTALGFVALNSNSIGEFNVAVGTDALANNLSGNGNVAIGRKALEFSVGNANIALGSSAGSLVTGSNNILIGNDGVIGESNVIRLGNPSTHTKTVLSGDVGIGNSSPAVKLDVTGNATISGNVGIGVAVPTKAKLEINGNFGVFAYFQNYGLLLQTGALALTTGPGSDASASLYCSATAVAGAFLAYSDERIKRIAGRSDAAEDLATLRSIEVTDYTFIDTIAKGTGAQKKVIAQQVEKVFPQAVRQQTDVVPDIFQQAEVKDGWIALATNLKRGERVRILKAEGEGVHEVIEVEADRFRVDFKPTDDHVFVYGREVKDFRAVDYEALSMLNVSATQELARKLEAKSGELNKVQGELTKLRKEKAAVAQELAALEARDAAREARLARLEAAAEVGLVRVSTAAVEVK